MNALQQARAVAAQAAAATEEVEVQLPEVRVTADSRLAEAQVSFSPCAYGCTCSQCLQGHCRQCLIDALLRGSPEFMAAVAQDVPAHEQDAALRNLGRLP